jgi:hypothetical protein
MKMNTNRWAAYGKWRSGVYPEIELVELTAVFRAYYDLPDLNVIWTQLKPHAGIEWLELVYPAMQIDKKAIKK